MSDRPFCIGGHREVLMDGDHPYLACQDCPYVLAINSASYLAELRLRQEQSDGD